MTIIYASPSGTGNGTTYLLPTTLSNAYAISVSGDTIQLASGSYAIPTPNGFVIGKSITIIGDASTNTTIFNNTGGSQVISSQVINIQANNVRLENLYIRSQKHAATAPNMTQSITIVGSNGITGTSIVNCRIAHNGSSNNGCIYFLSSDLTKSINNTTISGCEIFGHSSPATSNYGINIQSSTTNVNGLYISNTIFRDHTTGAGIYAATNPTFPGLTLEPVLENVIVDNCNFYNCGVSSGSYTGAIFVERFNNSTVKNCTFTAIPIVAAGNYPLIQLSIKKLTAQNITFENNTFTGANVPSTSLPSTGMVGIYVQGRNDGASYSTNPGAVSGLVIKNNTFTGLGAGVRFGGNILDSSVTLDNCTFTDNIQHVQNWKIETTFRVDCGTSKFTSVSPTYAISDSNISDAQRSSLLANNLKDTRTILKSNYIYTNPTQTIAAAITVANTGEIIYLGTGDYNVNVLVNKSVTIIGPQYNVLPYSNNTVRSGDEAVIKGDLANAGNCFTITANNVEINGVKTVLVASGANHRDAFNIQLDVNETSGTTTQRNNVTIKNNIIISEATTNQRQSLVVGEGTDPSKTSQAGKGEYNNILFNNNYIDFTLSNASVRGILFNSYYAQMSYNTFEISSNIIKHSALSANTPLGSYFGSSLTRPILYNGLKIQNNNITAALATGIRGIFDMDSTSIISGNTLNTRHGTWVNFRESGGLIENNIFNTSHSTSAISLWVADGQYSNCEPQDVTVSGNTFNVGSNTRHIQLDNTSVNLENIINNNTFGNGAVKIMLASVSYTKNSVTYTYNPIIVYPYIQNGIDNALSNGTVTVYSATYLENVTLNKQITLEGASKETTILKSSPSATTATLQITDGASGSTIKNLTINGRVTSLSTSGNGNSSNDDSSILVLNTDTTNNPEINNLIFDNLIISNASNGIAFNNKHSTNILIKSCVVRGNEDAAIRVSSNTETFNGFTIQDSTLLNNNGPALTTNPSGSYRPNNTNFSIVNSVITNNNKLTLNNNHDVSLFGFNGNLNIEDVTITSNHLTSKQTNGTSSTSGGWGLIIYGRQDNDGTRYSMGNLTINNLTMIGNVIKSGVGIDRYSTLGDVSINNFSIKELIPNGSNQSWPLLSIGHNDEGKSFELGTTKLTTLVVTSIGNINAINSEFYSPTNTLLLINKNIPSNIPILADQIYDKTDNYLLGAVKILENVNIISPSDPAAVTNLISELNSENYQSGQIVTIILLPGNYQTTGLTNVQVQAELTLLPDSTENIVFNTPHDSNYYNK
jgi:hypothetical protein